MTTPHWRADENYEGSDNNFDFFVFLLQRVLENTSPNMETSRKSWSWKIQPHDDQGKNHLSKIMSTITPFQVSKLRI